MLFPPPHNFQSPPRPQSTAGFTLLEVLAALALFSTLTIILILSLSQLLKRQSATTQQNISAFLMQQTMENIYTLAQTDQWAELTTDHPDIPFYVKPGTEGAWIINTSSPTDTELLAGVYVAPVYRSGAATDDPLSPLLSIDPECQTESDDCLTDPDFKKITINIWPTDDPNKILSHSTHYLAPTAKISQPIPLSGTGDMEDPTGYQVNPDGLYTTSRKILVPADDYPQPLNFGNTSNWSGLRFSGIDSLPKNSEIHSATVYVKTKQSFPGGTEDHFNIYGDRSPQNPDFDNLGPSCPPRSCTTNFISVDASTQSPDADNLIWKANFWYSLGDLSNIMQEIVNSDTWGITNSATFLVNRTNGTTQPLIYSREDDLNSSAQLYISFTPPPAGAACLSGGGSWAGFPNQCADLCSPSPTCSTTPATSGCDCGPTQCWNGTACIPTTPTVALLPDGSDCTSDSQCQSNNCLGAYDFDADTFWRPASQTPPGGYTMWCSTLPADCDDTNDQIYPGNGCP